MDETKHEIQKVVKFKRDPLCARSRSFMRKNNLACKQLIYSRMNNTTLQILQYLSLLSEENFIYLKIDVF